MTDETPPHILNLSRNNLFDLEDVIKKITSTITSVHFGHNNLLDVSLLNDILQENLGIREIVLSHNNIQDINPLFHGLMYNTTLTTLNLSHNSITYVECVRETLARNTTLKELIICENFIMDIAPFFDSASLENLDLSWNKITLADPFHSLSPNTSLKKLNLEGNEIFNISELCEALLDNQSLTELSLEDNHISDLMPLGMYLERNTTLTFLNLANNPLSTLIPLHDAVRVNTTLAHLNIARCEVPIDGLLDAIRTSNGTITYLYYGWTLMHTVFAIQHILPYLERNKHNRRLKNITLFEMILERQPDILD